MRSTIVRVFSLFFLMSMSLAVASTDSSADSFCEDLYIVEPPGSDSGTIFLAPEMKFRSTAAGEVEVYPRAGYLSAGSLVLIKEKDRILIRKHFKDDKRYYYRFVSDTGLSGHIRANSVRPLSEYLNRGAGSSVDCQDIDAIVAPVGISEGQDVRVYHRPRNRISEPELAFPFSRTNFDLVFIDREREANNIAIGDYGPNHSTYFRVWFFQREKGRSGWFLKQGLLKVSESSETVGTKATYLVVQMPPESAFVPIASNAEWCRSHKILCGVRFVEGLFSKKSEMEEVVGDLLEKSCDLTVEIGGQIEVKAGAENILGILGFSIAGSGKISKQLPVGEVYEFANLHGGLKGETFSNLSTVGCHQSVPQFSKAMDIVYSVSHERPKKKHIHVSQSDVLKSVAPSFVEPSATRVVEAGDVDGIRRMFEVPYREEDGAYFEAFEQLRRMLYSRVDQHLSSPEGGNSTLNSLERRRVIAFLTTTAAYWLPEGQ